MVSSKIEHLLFRDKGVHAVVEFALTPNKLLLTVAPWVDLSDRLSVEFAEFKILYLEVYPDESEDLNLPWDIIGFDCDEIDLVKWQFVLHCNSIEICFESKWAKLIHS